jgi:hypothetical protein
MLSTSATASSTTASTPCYGLPDLLLHRFHSFFFPIDPSFRFGCALSGCFLLFHFCSLRRFCGQFWLLRGDLSTPTASTPCYGLPDLPLHRFHSFPAFLLVYLPLSACLLNLWSVLSVYRITIQRYKNVTIIVTNFVTIIV